MSQKNSLTLETEQLENLLSEIDLYLNGKTRSELIEKAPELLQMSMEINRKPTTSFVTASVQSDFQSAATLSDHRALLTQVLAKNEDDLLDQPYGDQNLKEFHPLW